MSVARSASGRALTGLGLALLMGLGGRAVGPVDSLAQHLQLFSYTSMDALSWCKARDH
jgi:hypothetical protein